MKLSKRKKNVTKYNLKTEKDHPLGIITISRKYVAIVAQLLGDLTTIPLTSTTCGKQSEENLCGFEL